MRCLQSNIRSKDSIKEILDIYHLEYDSLDTGKAATLLLSDFSKYFYVTDHIKRAVELILAQSKEIDIDKLMHVGRFIAANDDLLIGAIAEVLSNKKNELRYLGGGYITRLQYDNVFRQVMMEWSVVVSAHHYSSQLCSVESSFFSLVAKDMVLPNAAPQHRSLLFGCKEADTGITDKRGQTENNVERNDQVLAENLGRKDFFANICSVLPLHCPHNKTLSLSWKTIISSTIENFQKALSSNTRQCKCIYCCPIFLHFILTLIYLHAHKQL